MIADIGFIALATLIFMSAVLVVRSSNLIHAVLWLAISLLGTAALYAMLEAPFLAGVQVLTYVGGVVTLMLFGIMVTRRHEGVDAKTETDTDERGFIAAVAMIAVFALAMWKTDLTTGPLPPAVPTERLATMLLDDYLLAFEVISLLLLAAIIGAVVLARRKDPSPLTGREEAIKPARRPAVEPARQAPEVVQ